jgi:hypothetical protein
MALEMALALALDGLALAVALALARALKLSTELALALHWRSSTGALTGCSEGRALSKLLQDSMVLFALSVKLHQRSYRFVN